MEKGKRGPLEKDALQAANLNGIYRDIANLLGCDAAAALHSAFRGQQITFPVEFFSKAFIAERIRVEYNGTNLKDLATKFGYTEKWLRHILRPKDDQ